MNFYQHPPSKEWATLKFKGETFAEVWFKPDGEPLILRFRILQNSFQIPGLSQHLTVENLLKGVGQAIEDVETWRYGDVSYDGMSGSNSELKAPLVPPVEEVSLHLDVIFKPSPQLVAVQENTSTEVSPATWQNLEVRWNTLLGAEASIETLRLMMEGLRAELEAATNRSLTTDEKVHGPNADVAQWNKAKNRVRYALPKAREFVHRATWAMGTPERKKLDELFKNHIHPRIPFPNMDKVPDELDNLLKDRQILSAQGTAAYQECKGCHADFQSALRTLQSNANKKRVANRAKGKSF